MPLDHRTIEAIQEAVTRHQSIVQRLTDLLASDYPDDIWPYLGIMLADIPELAELVARQGIELAQARIDRANLAAAALAVLAATRDGETDALSYLRDELRAQGNEIGRSDSYWSGR